jgi:hypothetical protein
LCHDLALTAEGTTAMPGYPNQGDYSNNLIAARKSSITSSISKRKFDIDVEINLSETQMRAFCCGFMYFFQSDKIQVFVIHLPSCIQWAV